MTCDLVDSPWPRRGQWAIASRISLNVEQPIKAVDSTPTIAC